MSPRRHNIQKKRVIKKKNFTRRSKLPYRNISLFFSSINYNSVIKDVLKRLLYFFLTLVIFPIISVFIVGALLRGNVHYPQNLSLLFAFIINLIVFAKIISLRSNWKTLFFKYPHTLPFKDILLKKKYFLLTTSVGSILKCRIKT